MKRRKGNYKSLNGGEDGNVLADAQVNTERTHVTRMADGIRVSQLARRNGGYSGSITNNREREVGGLRLETQ